MKVTDKRMFTPEGELREEYRDLGAEETAPPPSGGPAEEAPEPVAREPRTDERPAIEEPQAPPAGRDGERLEFPSTPEELGGPGFIDLLAMLANPAAVYLGDAQLPDGESVEDLELARFHIDLLDVLRTKTAGNLAAQEVAAVDDLLYQLRLRYVQKKGQS